MRAALCARTGRACRRTLTGATLLAALAGLAPATAASAPAGKARPAPAAGPVAAPDHPADAPGGLEVDLTEIAPAVLAAEDSLTVRGTVTNGTGTDVETLELRLRMQSWTPVSRSALESWLEPTTLSATSLLAVHEATSLPAGQSTAFVLEVPAEDLPFGPSAWGPRGIEVEATTASGESARARSLAVRAPVSDLAPTQLSVLVPAVPTGAERAVDGGLTAGGAARLSSVLELLSGTGATLAVDPATPADPAELEAFDGEVVALPWSDADDAALAHAGRTDLLRQARERVGELTTPALTTLAWPVHADEVTAEAVAATGAEAVVTAGSALEVTEILTYTPTGRADLETSAGTLDAVVADDRLSALLLGQRMPVTRSAGREATAVDGLTARQLLLADTAVITRERPNDPRGLALVVPRSAMARLDPATLAELLGAVGQAPWADVVPVSRLLATQAPGVEREQLVGEQTVAAEVSADTLATMDATLATATRVAQVLEDPQPFLGALENRLGSVVAAGWRSDPAERDERVRVVAEEVAGLDGRLVAEPSSTLNLINDDARIPVRISNDLDQAARVQVLVEGPGHRLRATDVVEAEVPPGSQATAHVPVHAVGSGTVQVTARLLTPAGEAVGTPAELTVRVRADWEDVGTAVGAVVLLVLLVAGLVRTVRRGRRMAPVADEDEA